MLDLTSLVNFLVLGVIGWITYKVYIWPFYISPLRKIPGPPSDNPFYGNLKTLITEQPDNQEPQHQWVKKYGTLVKYNGLFNKPTLYVADQKIIQKMTLSKTYEFVKPITPGVLELTGNGLVFAEGDIHKRQRKMMNPAFTHSNIKEMTPTFIHVASTLKGLIENELKLGKSDINFTPLISKTTLDIIGLVGFSYELNSLTSPNELAEAYDSILNSPSSNLRIAIVILLRIYIPYIKDIPIELNRKFKKSCAVIAHTSKKLIEEKHKKAKNGELKEKDLLSLLISINKTLPDEEKMTDEELKSQIMTFLLAGHETTNATTCWALFYLAKYPHMQDLLREELVKAFPDKSKFNPTFDELSSLEYLNCVIKETLRFNTPAPTVRRTNLKDEFFGEYLIPKNTEIFIGISALHKSTKIWGPTAEEFNPKRWLDPSLNKNVSNLNFLPFLNGERGCIGNKLALSELRVLLSMLVRNFAFKPIDGFNIKRRVIPMPKPAYLALNVSIVEF